MAQKIFELTSTDVADRCHRSASVGIIAHYLMIHCRYLFYTQRYSVNHSAEINPYAPVWWMLAPYINAPVSPG